MTPSPRRPSCGTSRTRNSTRVRLSVSKAALPLQQQEGERENERTNEHRLPIPLACLMTFLPPSYLPSRIPPPSPVPTTHARAAAVASRGKKKFAKSHGSDRLPLLEGAGRVSASGVGGHWPARRRGKEGRKEGRKGSGSRILLYKRSEAGAISGFLV